ncbi:tartrate dehydrogenase/decarboxylase/D-malate dehydrogenase [Geomicrobium halophilum]|uniref:D-malate dehydrogenase (decarboxylating) n=1 Tax=Geomicrobium halophilum TaxID=549000 RepID=A0A841PSM3_9BACL|nr:tartrate dehydrogenase [Geomicrobium halophilum]MBB6450186.1 tartrate dehydrogenase/decarboxylase/D-malate dehydrogenase [Geomicrobium halophilum]
MDSLKIAVLPGDGVGEDIVPDVLPVLDRLAEIHGSVKFDWRRYDWNCRYYLEHGEMMPADGLDQLSDHDAIFLGAVGDPARVPDHISLWGLLIKIRREFEQVLNIRPAKSLKGIRSPLQDGNSFDFVVVRENSEGEYSQIGGRLGTGADEIAVQNAVFTRKAIERAVRYAYQLAASRAKKVTAATKSNGIIHTMPFWDEISQQVAQEDESITFDLQHIDALAANFITKPHTYDVVVASNLFGDILTDMGAAMMGSIGVAPAANLNVNGKWPSMFEPVHGSAPDIVGKGIANPMGQLWTAKMMLEHLGYEDMGEHLLGAIEAVLADGVKTPDIGGTATTGEVIAAVNAEIGS